MVAFAQGDPEQGLRLALESASAAESSGLHLVARSDAPRRGRVVDRRSRSGGGASRLPRRARGVCVSVQDRVNLPFGLAARRGDRRTARRRRACGSSLGSRGGVAEREPKSTTEQALLEYGPYVERVSGPDFERGRAHGRALSLEEAVDYALSADV